MSADEGHCDECGIDKVALGNVIHCAILSMRELMREISEPNCNIFTVLTKKDRIYYIIGMLIIAMLIRVCTT